MKVIRPIQFDKPKLARRRQKNREYARARRARSLDTVHNRVTRIFRYPDFESSIFWESYDNDNWVKS